jgi:hypothetical protein
MSVGQFDPKLRSRQRLHHSTFHFGFFFRLSHRFLYSLWFLPISLVLLALMPADGFLFLNPSNLAFRYEKAFAAHIAENPAPCDFLAEALEQLLLTFIGF